MNKISLYTLLILLFLGLSKSFSPSSQKTQFVVNEQVFASMFQGAPVSLVLLDAFQAGFLIKTHYLKFKFIHGFKQAETVVVRTNPTFWKKHQSNIGMTLFRRSERNNEESTTPLPPGSLYVGDPAFGFWKYHNSGDRRWYFHRAYRHFNKKFFWKEFRPNYSFYEKVKIHLENEKAFYGLNSEFGTEGTVTKELYSNSSYRKKGTRQSFLDHIWYYVSLPPWSSDSKKKEDKEKK
jgi:hypothetical protein